MIMGSGPMVQFVLFTLIFFSVLCWTIVIAKAIRFRQARGGNAAFLDAFSEGESLGRCGKTARNLPESPMAQVYLAGFEELRRLQEGSKSRPLEPGVWLAILERSLRKGIQEEVASLERRLPILATIGNSAPFIGLFGTVWGIMRSFSEIGLQGSASLATVAPGISEALIATATGLAAAIPSVIAYNFFMSALSRMETELQGFAGDFMNLVERRLAPSKSSPTPSREAD
ncbi:MAG: MotA/TolQ/ExbB proton channel family protein [Deltaproteobacteria bacterium]